jgi:hypothetical protein
MSPELALLEVVWDTVKSYAQKKDRLEIAEFLVRAFDEHLNIEEDIQEYKNEFDSVMKAAILSHYDYFDRDGDESEEWID